MQPQTTGADTHPLLMTVSEAATELRVSTEHVYRLIRGPEDFPAIKVGSAIRVPRAALLAWIAEQGRAAA